MNREQLATLLYKKALLPLTSRNPELAHNNLFKVFGYLEKSGRFIEALRKEFQLPKQQKVIVDSLGLEFPSSFLLAEGLIKSGEGAAVIAQFGMGGLGIGTLTYQSRAGNPLVRDEGEYRIRRIERFPDGTIINYMDWPNQGIQKSLGDLKEKRRKINIPIILSIGSIPELENKEEIIHDLRNNLTFVYLFHPDLITLNLSCPNADCIRDRNEQLERSLFLIKAVSKISTEFERVWKEKPIPRMVKIGPDMTPDEIKLFVQTAKENGYAGIVATNTTIDRTGPFEKYAYIKKGGISGPLLFEKALRTVQLVRKYDREQGGNPLVIIGCGGIDSIEKWLKMKEAGADLAQIMTGFIFGGPYFFKKLNRDLLKFFPH